jgi:two-component system chemotaxis sensor kinase CheA
VSAPDRALSQLLAAEIDKRLPVLEDAAAGPAVVRAELHSLRGSAALAGEADLALVLAHLTSRMRAGDLAARPEAALLLLEVQRRIGKGEPAFATAWPTPPPGLGPSNVDPRYRREYLATVGDRLVELDALASSDAECRRVLEDAYRAVHGTKGAAGSVGDDLTAWYCHGLEARLKAVLASGRGLEEAAGELGRHRAVLALLIEEPVQALETLRALPGADARGRPSAPPSRPPAGGDELELEDAPLRVPGAAIEGLIERLDRVDVAHQELRGTADAARQLAQRLRDARASLIDALRAIGPPRPWGAPAAALARIEATTRVLGAAAEHASFGAAACRRTADALHARSKEMRGEMAALRRTTLGWLFARVAYGIERLAQREGRLIRVDVAHAELPLDRGLAERLLDPLMQLARNAVAHGMKPPELRASDGKDPVGTITLAAERLGDWLRIVIEDDGQGVDIALIRRLAAERGALSPEAAESASEDELFALLFLPGLTTRADPDVLAGRGVGLELARDSVRRLGGAIRLSARPGGGLRATIEVPSERGLVEVVWLGSGGLELALPVSFTGRLARAADARPMVDLTRCLGVASRIPPKLAVELVIAGVQPIAIGVETMGRVEEAAVRALPPLVAAAGPFGGAILRGDGSLKLLLDAALLAARAWAHAV